MEATKGIVEVVKSNWNSEKKQKYLKKKFNQLTAIKKDINNQLQMVESRSGKKRKNEVANWLVEVERVEDEFKNFEAEMREARWRSKLWGERVQSLREEVCELIGNSRFQGVLVLDVCETKTESLPVTQLVGEAFQDNLEKIWASLMKDGVSSIGIYGMGGIGKTTLVRHVYNLLLERQSTFNDVYWITVSQDFCIRKLQDRIANVIQFNLRSEDEEIVRAAKLLKVLDKKHKSIIILDDLWNQFSLEEVGIPMSCKLIMTTRSLEICRMMSCNEKMKLEPLSKEESLNLFVEKLGNYATLSLEVKEIAKSVIQECDGLPLGMVTLAGSMRGVDDVREWRSVLEQLKQSINGLGEMDDKVFKVLNWSYERLRDPVLQKCFLYCALFPEDHEIWIGQLIEYFIDEDIIKDLNNRQTQYDQGHTILNKLKNVCLLEDCLEKDYVKMHDLVRDMAINKMKGNPKTMVEAGKRLKEVPNVIEWSKDLVRVSLMENDIKEIPWGHSPSCHNYLSTLLLWNNRDLEFIADSFFLQFCGLKVLDLSCTAIKMLPGSTSNLLNLTSLLVRCCHQLWYIPSLATLKTLKKLDLWECRSVEVVPGGLELLSNLQYLDMHGTKIKDIPNGLLSNLSHVQFLRLPWSTAVEVKSGCLGKVEYLECRFLNRHDFHSMTMDYHEWQLLSSFFLIIGELNFYDDDGECVNYNIQKPFIEGKKSVVYSKCDIGKDGDFVEIPKVGQRLDVLGIFGCHALRSLDNAPLADGSGAVHIRNCEGLEYLVSLCGSSSSSTIFDHVMELRLRTLYRLQDLISREGAPSPSFRPGGVFSCLKDLSIWECPSVTSLFPYELLPNLHNLERIEVKDCEMIELIIGEESNSDSHGNHTEFISLPKLKILVLWNLPELKSISSKKMTCDSMGKISIENCPKLRRMSLSLLQIDNGQISPLPSLVQILIDPKEWWDSVEWDHPNAKDVLQPLLKQFEEMPD